jgi:hypothetical protein
MHVNGATPVQHGFDLELTGVARAGGGANQGANRA